jgi:hypothetical protein
MCLSVSVYILTPLQTDAMQLRTELDQVQTENLDLSNQLFESQAEHAQDTRHESVQVEALQHALGYVGCALVPLCPSALVP